MKLESNKKPTSDAIEILHRRYYEGHPDRIASLEEERANAEVARKIYDLRQEAGLTQRELAKLVGTTASVICRLEDADYEGHSLAMLNRVAAALGMKPRISFVRIPMTKPTSYKRRLGLQPETMTMKKVTTIKAKRRKVKSSTKAK